MPLVQWVMQNLPGPANILRCESSVFAHCEVYQIPTILKCISKIFATATFLPGPISGQKVGENQWNLAGVYAILPNNYRKHKYIEINFKFKEDTYNESRYTENEVKIYLKDVLFEESKEEFRPNVKIESVSFEISHNSNLNIQLESVEKYDELIMKPKKYKKKKKAPTMSLQSIGLNNE